MLRVLAAGGASKFIGKVTAQSLRQLVDAPLCWRRFSNSDMESPGPHSDAAVPAARSTRINPGERVDLEEYNQRWLTIWRAGLQPGQRFDAGAAAPLLTHLFATGRVPVTGRRVLVPGCGRGYDVTAAAEAGAALAVGLDIASEAVEAACARRDAEVAPDIACRAVFEAADFFSYKHPDGPFDVGYDYTFLCALPPDGTRKAWADAWARHLSPGGDLVTLIFPVDPTADPSLGPPFPVTPELYTELLTPAGFECIELAPVPTELSHPARAGREWLGRWRRPSAPAASTSKI